MVQLMRGMRLPLKEIDRAGHRRVLKKRAEMPMRIVLM
jgi:hypothetical protein